MADAPTTVAPAAQPTTPVKPSFTSEPTKLPETATAVSATTPDPKPGETPPATSDQKPDALVSALAKANSEARTTKKQAADLQSKVDQLTKELEAKKEIEGKLTAAEKRFLDIVENPKLLLSHEKWSKADGGAFKAILDKFAEDEVPEDPRVSELEKKIKEREEKEAKDAADKAESDKKAEAAEIERINTEARGRIMAAMKEECAKEGADGTARWALISDDEGAAERARVEALAFCAGNGKPGDKDYRPPFDPTPEQAKELVFQALDQMEKDAREEIAKKSERLQKRHIPSNSDRGSFSQQHQSTEERQSPQTSVAAIRSQPLPTPTPNYRHGFTGGAPK